MSATDRNVEALRPIYEAWREGNWRCEAEEFLSAGDRVVVLTRYRGTGREGIELESPAAHVWTMRDGKATRLDVFVDRGRGLRSAGLNDAD
jgi:ketosteroid isomerase-like protein